MTEFLVSRANPSTGVATDRNWQNQTYSAPAPRSAAGTPQSEINLREALEWLLGSPQPQDVHLSEGEKEARKARRTELLIWLLNLELRLSPYGDPG